MDKWRVFHHAAYLCFTKGRGALGCQELHQSLPNTWLVLNGWILPVVESPVIMSLEMLTFWSNIKLKPLVPVSINLK